MMKSLALAAVFALVAPVAAVANTVDCGGNASTYAEVVEAKPGVRSKGPVTSVPDSLCADLIEDGRRQVDSLHVSIGDSGSASGPLSSAQGTSQRAPRRLPVGR